MVIVRVQLKTSVSGATPQSSQVSNELPSDVGIDVLGKVASSSLDETPTAGCLGNGEQGAHHRLYMVLGTWKNRNELGFFEEKCNALKLSLEMLD